MRRDLVLSERSIRLRQPKRRCLGWRVALTWLCLCGAGVLGEGGEAVTNATRTIHSSSEQFIVHGIPLTPSQSPVSVQPTAGSFRLDPAVLAISCERVKQGVLRTLRAPDQWRGKIHVHIRFSRATNQPVTIESRFLGSSWQFRVFVPDELPAPKLSRALVEVILLEMANRQLHPQLAEVPLWLSEGLTRQLLDSSWHDLVPQPQTRVLKVEQKPDPLRVAQERLRGLTALNFQELSLPTPEMLQGQTWDAFQASAHLFLLELLRQPGGPEALREMLRIQPFFQNWQLAFLEACRPLFQRPLDVEKWWALVVVNAGGGDAWHGWKATDTLTKLEQILAVPAQIRYTTNDLPFPTQLSLQKVVEHWSYEAQRDILRRKSQELNALRIHASPDLIPLIDDYVAALDQYLYRREHTRLDGATRGQVPPTPRVMERDITRQLDALDARRAALASGRNPHQSARGQ